MTNYLRAYRADDGTSDSGPIRFVASTEGVKGDGHDLRADAWSLDRFKRNPVVLWSHDFFGNRPPIGKATAAIEGKALMADVTFDDHDDFARSIEAKYRRGFLNAVSVSWDVVNERNELLEISAVPVPMDPDALMERNVRGLHTITDILTTMIDDPGEPKGDEAEAVWIGAAVQMVRLFTATADDAERQRDYRRLCRQYQRLGKEAPELPDTLAALDMAAIRGLFLEGEPELLPEAFAERQADTEREAYEALSRIQEMLTGVTA